MFFDLLMGGYFVSCPLDMYFPFMVPFSDKKSHTEGGTQTSLILYRKPIKQFPLQITSLSE